MKVAPHVMRRFTTHKPPGNPKSIGPEHPAAVGAHTVYPLTVREPGDEAVMKSGQNSRKIGAVVTKGKWVGMPVFTLTLEERATCPTTCGEWASCFGNKMHLARRFRHGPDLLRALYNQLEALDLIYPGGFVVRLHVLGDFYSAAYAAKWVSWLDEFPALRVFGYTAHPPESEIGRVLEAASHCRWDRFAIRFSGSGAPERSTMVVAHEALAPSGSIVCPAQTVAGAHLACGSCSLCWASKKPVTFVRH